jgi:predicted metal-binding membrane protein
MTTASTSQVRLLIIGLVGLLFVSWSATIFLMGGVHANHSNQIDPFISYLISWIIMMTAMMLPAEIRFALVFHQFSSGSNKKKLADLSTWFFLVGYFLVWATFGAIAYWMDVEISRIGLDLLLSDQHKSVLAGAIIVVSGLYQLSSMKQSCLIHCTSPIPFFFRKWKPGVLTAVKLGIEHGVVCVGCCWGLMLILLALGSMDLFWMSVMGLIMFAEKIFAWMHWFTKPLGVGLIVLGVWIGFSPSTEYPFHLAPHLLHTGLLLV